MTEKQLAKELLEVIPALVHFIRLSVRASASGVLTVPQFRVLANIRRGLTTVSDVAEHQGVSQPAMSKMVGGLEDRGLLRGAADRHDTRKVRLVLTAKGEKLYQKTLADAQVRMAKHLKRIPQEERVHLIRALGALSRGLEATDP